MSGHHQPAPKAQREAAPPVAPVAREAQAHPNPPVATQPANYSQPYPNQTQQALAGYHYNPNYPAHLAGPTYTYPSDPSHYQQSHLFQHHQSYPVQQPQPPHQPYPSMSDQVLPPPPPPPGQPPVNDEEARLKDAVLQAKRDVLEAKVANNNPAFRRALWISKEAHRELEEHYGGRCHRHRIDKLTKGFNPFHLNPCTMEPFEEPCTASTSCRKRARDETIDDLAEDALDLLDMINMVKRVKQKKDGDSKSDPKGKGKEKEQ